MFIAIEGPDGVGKSSLIAAIGAELRYKLGNDISIAQHHKGRPPEETRRCLFNEYVLSLESQNLFDEIHLADRWHWGERTYAPFKRPHTNKDGYGLLGRAGWRWVELFMQSRGMAQFMLVNDLDVIKSRVAQRGDDFINVSELEGIYNAYIDTAKVSTLAMTVQGASSFDELPALARIIIDVATETSDKAKHCRHFPKYIGAPNPKVLLVGDQRNITKKHGEDSMLPFMPVNGNSGEFLLTSLPDKLWKHVGIINGGEFEPGEIVKLHHVLGEPPIVALGRRAEKALLRTTIHCNDYVTIPHPQLVRRFKNSQKESYGNAILSISRGKGANGWALK